MKLLLNNKNNNPYADAFREIATYHNVRNARLLSAIIGLIGLVLFLINRYTSATQVLKYPREYAAAITFLFITSSVCYIAFLVSHKTKEEIRIEVYQFLTYSYAIVIVVSSLWITFVMQHNPSNKMSIFVLGILSVAALWIFEKRQTFTIAILILILFNGGLYYFQTDACKLFTNYITGTCVSIFFVCISRVCFLRNYKHFIQLKKIEENNQNLTKINEMQTEILSVVAHDLRSPNNTIIGLMDILQHPSTTPDERQEYYDMISDTCNMSNTIIEDLLEVVRAETNTMLSLTCMNDLIEQELIQFIKGKKTKHKIVLELANQNLYVLINTQKMMRVFENLVTNAMKFTEDDGIIMISLEKAHNKVRISIMDTGIGIPKDLFPLLFRKFSQAGRTGLRGEKSYGLGLSICKLFLKQQNGDIAAYSEEGKGTKMVITLPLEDSKETIH